MSQLPDGNQANADTLLVDGPISLSVHRSDQWDLTVIVIGEVHNEYVEGTSRPGTLSVEDFLISISENSQILFEYPDFVRNDENAAPWIAKLVQNIDDLVFADIRIEIFGRCQLMGRMTPTFRLMGRNLTMDDIVRYTPLLTDIEPVYREWLIASIGKFFVRFQRDLLESKTREEQERAISGKVALVLDMYVMALILTSQKQRIAIYVGEAHAYIYRVLLECLEFKVTYKVETEQTPLRIDPSYL